ncbi:hypothetical protein PG997_002982 [Apiospora hydei]|uniref:Uncharacterized protein n=1 Tax=Apiospora hydei TaxID=1337664 RepID=A0ABR1WY08_9PEZI
MQSEGNGESAHYPGVYPSPPIEDSDDSDDNDEMEISGDVEALDDPERPQLRVIVQPPAYMDDGVLFNRPLVVLGPLDVAYYALSAIDLETDKTAELGRRKSVSSSQGSESGQNAGSNTDDPDFHDPAFHVQPEALQVGVSDAPITHGYLVRPSEYYRHVEEPQGYGYAIWHNLSIYSPGDDLRLWIRAMDARGETIAGIMTDPVSVESVDSKKMVGQPEAFSTVAAAAASQLRAPPNVYV